MNSSEMIRQMFQKIDMKDTDFFLGCLTDDAAFQFGNAQPVVGKALIRENSSGFNASIKSMQHNITEMWEHPDAVICRGTVTYTRLDATQLTVPFANIFKLDGSLIREYLVYVDISELFPQA